MCGWLMSVIGLLVDRLSVSLCDWAVDKLFDVCLL